jgi:hypothetical protein
MVPHLAGHSLPRPLETEADADRAAWMLLPTARFDASTHEASRAVRAVSNHNISKSIPLRSRTVRLLMICSSGFAPLSTIMRPG